MNLYRLENYHLSPKEFVQSFFVSEIGLRHYQEAEKKAKNWLGHKVIAIIELIPIFGFLGSLIEKVIFSCHDKFFVEKKNNLQFDKKVTKVTESPAFSGFPNLGHSCFMNAALQGIFATRHIHQILNNELKRGSWYLVKRNSEDENVETYIPEPEECFQGRKELLQELKRLYEYRNNKDHEKIKRSLLEIIRMINKAQLYREWRAWVSEKKIFDPISKSDSAETFAGKILSALDYNSNITISSEHFQKIKSVSQNERMELTANDVRTFFDKETVSLFHEPPALIKVHIHGLKANEKFPVQLDTIWDFTKVAPQVFNEQKGLYKLVARLAMTPNHSITYLLENNSWHEANDSSVKKVSKETIENHPSKTLEVLYLERI